MKRDRLKTLLKEQNFQKIFLNVHLTLFKLLIWYIHNLLLTIFELFFWENGTNPLPLSLF